MDQARRPEKPGRKRASIGVGILLVTQLATAALTRRTAVSESGVFAATPLAVLGLLAIAALNVRHTPYPKRAYLSMVAIMGAAVLITPVLAASPESWAERTRDTIWLFPWILVFWSFMPAPRRGICAADSRYIGWLMIGTALLLGAVVQL